MTTTIDRTDQYDALTREQQLDVLAGGDIRHLPIQCEYCDRPGAWSTAEGGRAVIACDKALHIAYSESWGAQAFPEDVMHIVTALKSTNPRENYQ